MNPETVVYPNLISLEVSEADVLSRAADEQANRLRPSDAAADRLKPEVILVYFVALCTLFPSRTKHNYLANSSFSALMLSVGLLEAHFVATKIYFWRTSLTWQ